MPLSYEQMQALEEKGQVKTIKVPKADSLPAPKTPDASELPPLNRGAGRIAADVASVVGSQFDRVTGAPSRAGLNALVEGKGLKEAAVQFKNQFGKDAELAPTGKEIATRIGFSDAPVGVTQTELSAPSLLPKSVSPAGAAGLGIDLLADYTNYLPVKQIAKGAVLAGEGTGKVGTGIMKMAGYEDAAEAFEAAYKGNKAGLLRMFNPRIADDWESAQQIAIKHGIDPALLSDSVKYGENSSLARKGRAMAEGPGGQERLDKHVEGLNAIRDATDRFIVGKLGGGQAPTSVENAGLAIKEGYDKAVSGVFDSMELTYANAGQQLGIQALDPEAGQKIIDAMIPVQKDAEWLAKAGGTRGRQSQGKFMQERLEAIYQAVQEGDFDTIVRHMQETGKASYVNVADIGWDEKSGRKLYDAMKEAVLETIEKSPGGKSARMMLEENNKALKALLDDTSILEKTIKEKGGEQIFQELVASGSSKKLDALQRILSSGDEALRKQGKETLNLVRSTWLETLKKWEPDGGFRFNSIGNPLRNSAREKLVASKLFSPDELDELGELISLGEAHGPWSKAILSTSGTGASNSFRETLASIKRNIIDEGAYEYLKRKAEKARGKPPPGGSVPPSRFSPNRSTMVSTKGAVPSNAKQAIKDYGASLVPSRSRVVNKAMQTYSVQDALRRRKERE